MINNNYIMSRLQGRTGNMMFQIAHGFAKSIEYNRQFVVPSRDSSSDVHEKTLFRKIDFRMTSSSVVPQSNFIQSPFHYTELRPPNEHEPTVYAGWYQSEKFFKKYSEAIISLFSPTEEFIKNTLNEFPFLNDKVIGAINVRRGDYLEQPMNHPVITMEYINYSLKLLPHCDKILIISDDIEWCKENIKIKNGVFIENYYDCNALWLLSMCNHFIISNSSFSWWGAYLSRKKDKVVISPSTWVGPGIVDKMDDIWCDNWIKVPTEYNNGQIILKK